jgi:hypothetical protein
MWNLRVWYRRILTAEAARKPKRGAVRLEVNQLESRVVPNADPVATDFGFAVHMGVLLPEMIADLS